MKRMRTVADSDSDERVSTSLSTSESDVENSYNTDNKVETDSVSKSDSDNVHDTSSEEGDEYESDPWAPLKAEATKQSVSEFEELMQNFTAEERQPYLIRANPTALDLENALTELCRLIGNSKKQSKWNKSGIKNIPIRQPKSSRKRTKSNTKYAKNVDNTEMNDGSKEWLKLETKTGQNS
ncbi:Hypothetical predicted protein [Paramuricea clavata]|uniref:Uncharacterized protein n=1 Tax=Paramuricea clavata TaxID=317549 RepID=A0A7D9LJJ0_PARCT|nr:Hypothetical predicted protein [Paramuricea clavata]